MITVEIPKTRNRVAGSYTKKDVEYAAWRVYKMSVKYQDPHFFVPKYDHRYKFNREVAAMARQICERKGREFEADKAKNRERRLTKIENEKQMVSIFDRPLVKDYMANRSNIKSIEPNVIIFYSRNHWAKNEKDLKILRILAKYINK